LNTIFKHLFSALCFCLRTAGLLQHTVSTLHSVRKLRPLYKATELQNCIHIIQRLLTYNTHAHTHKLQGLYSLTVVNSIVDSH